MFTMNESMLRDCFMESGNSLEKLKEVTDTLTNHTEFIKWHSADIELLSFRERRLKDVDDGNGNKVPVDGVESYYLSPYNLPSDNPKTTLESWIKTHRTTAIPEELLKEWTDISKLAVVHNNKSSLNVSKNFYFISPNALQTLDRFGISGSHVSTPCYERDANIAKAFSKNLPVTVVFRSVNNSRKIFSILSDKYEHIKQDILFDVIEKIKVDGEMGEPKCYNWKVTNFTTELYIEFPEKAEELSKIYSLKHVMIPGILMVTSDTGDSSFKVFGTWRMKGHNSISINSEVKRKHIGKIDINTVLTDIENNIFEEYAKLPERLCELMGEDLTDASWDLTSETGIEKNRKMIEEIIKETFKKLGIVKTVGKKVEKKLREELLAEFDYTVPYTSYDIATTIMSLPERTLIIHESTSNKKRENSRDLALLQKVCAKAPFIDYGETLTVVLTA